MKKFNQKLQKKLRGIKNLSGLTMKDTERIVREVSNCVIEELKEGHNVRFDRLIFKVKVRKSRNSINPQTKEKIVVPEKRVPQIRIYGHKTL